MADMLGVGFSGGFFHSRAGLITDYLGEEWFAAMDAALRVAQEQDGYLWLYDEDLWPSGNAGGQVAGMKDEYRSASLRARLLAPGESVEDEPDCAVRAAYLITRVGVTPHASLESGGDPVETYAATRAGMTLQHAEPISPEEAAKRTDAERLVFFRCYAPKTGWWSGESYVNLLHPEVAQQFMRLTHEVYRRRYGAEFGARMPGIFTDEPQLGQARMISPGMRDCRNAMRRGTGRDFWADLPLLYFDAAESRKARLLIHRSILRQFCEAYSKPIYEWCEQHQLAHTGHYNGKRPSPGRSSIMAAA